MAEIAGGVVPFAGVCAGGGEMSLDLRKVEHVVAVAEEPSMTRAAARLHPTVTGIEVTEMLTGLSAAPEGVALRCG